MRRCNVLRSEPPPPRSPLLRWLALGWLLFLCVVAVHQWRFWQNAPIQSDVLALLPQEEHDELLRLANAKLAALGERRVVVLVGAPDAASARRAAQVVREVFATQATSLAELHDAPDAKALIDALQPWRNRLLTPQQREELATTHPDKLAQQALAQLYQPFGTPRLSPFPADPLSLWPKWWSERARASNARPADGELLVEGEGRQWAVLNFVTEQSAFSVSGKTPLADAIAAARTAAGTRIGNTELIVAGVPLFAEAAAARATFEMNTIGWGSLAAVLLLAWLIFASPRPILLVGLSLVVGCGVALSVTGWLFGQVHLLTLVFGASLVGVAEDYGMHWFAARQHTPEKSTFAILRRLGPGMFLALLTSVVAYLALGLAPLPGLRQMAVFSATGLTAAFLTVVWLFPFLDHRAPASTRFAERFAASLVHWPRWQANRIGLFAAIALFAFMALGLSRLSAHDDLRQLHAPPSELVAMQTRASALLGLPSPAQFFLVEGDSPEQVLQREEALAPRLDALREAGAITGWQGVSQWLPSQRRQYDDAQFTARAETAVLQRLNAELDEAFQRPALAPSPLTLEMFRQIPNADSLLPAWIGEVDGRHGSLVLLDGLSPASLSAMQDAASGLEGVRFSDRSATLSAALSRYRTNMGVLVLAGYLGVAALLFWRYRTQAWRVLLPTVLGSAFTLAVFGIMGWPLQLFGVLALLLLLGMGIDYGIFLLEHPGDGSAWLAVALAGISTLLAFGLLGLSATPALSAFGITMLIGELSIWLLTPFLRPQVQP